MSITFRLRTVGFQEFCFSIVFILCLAYFANQHTKSVEKHKYCKLIAPKQVKIDMPCENEKSLNLGPFSDTSVSFSHEDNFFPFSGWFTNSAIFVFFALFVNWSLNMMDNQILIFK